LPDLRPQHNRVEAKGSELVQCRGAYHRKHQKQPDKNRLIYGGGIDKLQRERELPDVKTDNANEQADPAELPDKKYRSEP